MKRGSSVLQPPSDAAKRLTHTNTHANTHANTHINTNSNTHANTHANTHTNTHTPDTHTAGSSPFPAATSLFSPDVSTKMASDLLIRLSEVSQKAQVHAGRPLDGDVLLEPGLALSPDGPGPSPEPPSISHTPDTHSATHTLASDMLRKLAERQEVSVRGAVRVKEEEEPMELSDLIPDRPIRTEITSPQPSSVTNQLLFTIKTEDNEGPSGNNIAGPKMEDQQFLHKDIKKEETVYQPGSKMEDGVVSGANMDDQFLLKANTAERPLSAAKLSNTCVAGNKMEEQFPASGVKVENQSNLLDHSFSVKPEEPLFFGAKMEEDQFSSGPKMADQCLRAVLWQDMSVNLASTLLHQLSERVSKTSSRPVERTTPPARHSPVLQVNADPLRSSPLVSSQAPPHENKISLSGDQTTSCPYFYRCHVCGFETDGGPLFHDHMTSHRQWERSLFSLHCCVCDTTTSQEPDMRAHANTHTHGHTGATGDSRCPSSGDIISMTSSTSSSSVVATTTQQQQQQQQQNPSNNNNNNTSPFEHRCRICQKLFPGQQELSLHFLGHRQGNQYRCELCGHLTRTANKLVEHVRVHTGERPFTCTLCPYSAKRRDSLRLHCKVKHGAADAHTLTHTQTNTHTHRSYSSNNNNNNNPNKHLQRLHYAHTQTHTHHGNTHNTLNTAEWKDLSPLLPITTLISLKNRSNSHISTSVLLSSDSTKQSFFGYLGLKTNV